MKYPVSELYLLQCSDTIDLRMGHHSLSYRFLLDRYEFPFRSYSWSEQEAMSFQRRARSILSRRGSL